VALKDFLTKQGLKLMQDPRFMKLVQDERVMSAVMQAFQLRGRLQNEFDEQVDRIAKGVGLATRREVRELKRTIRRMQGELDRDRELPKSDVNPGAPGDD